MKIAIDLECAHATFLAIALEAKQSTVVAVDKKGPQLNGEGTFGSLLDLMA